LVESSLGEPFNRAVELPRSFLARWSPSTAEQY
jgi:hypothetical protein